MENEKSSSQIIEVPLKAGAKVEILEDVDVDEDDGFTASVLYEGTVERHVPETGMIEMSNGVSRTELKHLIDKGEGVQILYDGRE